MMGALFLICFLLVQPACAGRLKRSVVGTSGKVSFSPVNTDSVDFINEHNVTLILQGQPVKLTRYQASNESPFTVSFYWTSSGPLPPSAESGYTASLKIHPSASCGQFAIVDFRATTVSDGAAGVGSTFAVPPSALNAAFACASGVIEKTYQLKATKEVDCVVMDDWPGKGSDSLPRPPYYNDGETFSFDCYARCTCTNGQIGCVPVCPPSITEASECRKAIRGSECCEVFDCLPEAEKQLTASCHSGSNFSAANSAFLSEEYPPWIAAVDGTKDEGVQRYVTILNEEWILGPANVLQRAKSISTSRLAITTHKIFSVIVAEGFIDAKSTPDKDLALAKLSDHIVFTGRGSRGVNLPWSNLCQSYFATGCPLTAYPYMATAESGDKCAATKPTNQSAIACVKLQKQAGFLNGDKKAVVGSGVVTLRSDGIQHLVGVLSDVVGDEKGAESYTILNICPHMQWIQSVMAKK